MSVPSGYRASVGPSDLVHGFLSWTSTSGARFSHSARCAAASGAPSIQQLAGPSSTQLPCACSWPFCSSLTGVAPLFRMGSVQPRPRDPSVMSFPLTEDNFRGNMNRKARQELCRSGSFLHHDTLSRVCARKSFTIRTSQKHPFKPPGIRIYKIIGLKDS